MNRRDFIRGAAAAGALPLFNVANAGFGQGRRARLAGGAAVRIAIVGCGSWGRVLLNRAGAIGGCELVALCDPDPNAVDDLRRACAKRWGGALAKAAVYADYREMFAKVGDTLDAVFVATPNHHHALPTLLALRCGADVYVEKPMAHTMEEVALIEREAKRCGAVVRVGNKGHCMTHRPKLARLLKEGVIGDVTEVFSFSDRPNTMFHRPPSCPPPRGMDWDLWCGGAPVAPNYAGENGRVGLHPHDWHSWIDYGNGSVGNMGTHVLDAPFQAMDMWKVRPSRIEVEDVKWGCPGAWNARGTMVFTMPARDGWGEVRLHWNDGVADGVDVSPKFMTGWYNRVYLREHTNFPPQLVELEKKWKVKKPLPSFGTVFVGTKGMVYEEFHRTIRIFPEGGAVADLPVPSGAELETEELRIVREFLGAVRGRPDAVNTGLDFSVPLAQTLMLANALAFAGRGAYAWDGSKTTSDVANAHLKVAYRKGWELV